MSLKKVLKVKADRGFKIWDLIVYGVICATVAALFIVLFAVRDDRPLQGVRFKYVNDIIYDYDFDRGEVSRNAERVEILEETGEKLTLKVKLADGDYNVVEIDKKGVVKIVEANCPKRDCVYGNVLFNSQITDSGGYIYCLPHSFQILPYDYDIDDGNIIV